MARIARGETVTIYGVGSAQKDYPFVEDLAAAVRRILDHSDATGCFNIGSGIGIATASLISKLESVVGRKAQIAHADPLPGDVSASVLDFSSIKSATGWEPKTSIEDGLSRTWEWMQPQLIATP